jgi:flagellar biosynthesis anti-sigma factor FlgM
MKIQNDGGNTAVPVSGDTANSKLSRKERAARASGEAIQPAADTVTTSEVARYLETDPARQERLDQLREQVQNGTYSVPATELSARLIDAHLGDLTKRS